ncbi:LysR family transcriptional regulator [Alteromonas pelagimontana]|uniref:LysR family transcriptional regulator n=1 Tax=Alteromonas pelagimontana TaxID=1858656 RepID=A0A6M4MEW6_9ALTE|nr:LysR family transcriptional regulator [Alteromonas pelagimontana]QJR80716.1 LysR family transcriptional regulator [Alteromonas pelagimontana]
MRFLLSRHLSQFIAIYDLGSLRAASSILGLTQPALSKSLHQFENLLDVVLFDRTGGKLTPTPFADILRMRANIILKEAEFTAREIEVIKDNFYKPMAASAGPVWLAEILPMVLPALYQAYPKFQMGIKLEGAGTSLSKIQSGDLDMYFGFIPESVEQKGLAVISLLNLRMTVYARRHHPIHQESPGRQLEMAGEYPWAGFGLGDGIENTVVKRASRFKGFTYGIESLLGLAKLAQQTDHIVISVDAVAETFADHDIVEVKGVDLDKYLMSGVVCRASLLNFSPVKFLIEEIRKRYSSH